VVTPVRGRRRVLVVPDSLDVPDEFLDGETITRFPDSFFDDTTGYNRLLLSEVFYKAFASWTHILIHQLDCLVFRDELDRWCAGEFDYVAAPWFTSFLPDTARGLWAVGNGGFSLRRVVPTLRTLRARAPKGRIYPGEGARTWVVPEGPGQAGEYRRRLTWYQRWLPALPRWTVADETRRYPFNEDLFWSFEAAKFYPRFRVASVEEALPFAFEMAPRWCFVKNQRRLPFGCHGWPRYDREFWLEHLARQRGGA
jgi:hypothetical protein